MRRVHTMPTAPARPEGMFCSALSARTWKWMTSCEGYSSPNAMNHSMKVPTTRLNKVPREKRWVAKLYTTCPKSAPTSGIHTINTMQRCGHSRSWSCRGTGQPYQKDEGGRPYCIHCTCTPEGQRLRYTEVETLLTAAAMQAALQANIFTGKLDAEGEIPVKNGITSVPPPTAVITRELPNLQQHIQDLLGSEPDTQHLRSTSVRHVSHI